MINHYFQHIGNDIYLLMVPYICLLFILSLVWDVYFVKMIMYYVRLYRECIKEVDTDIFGNASELALHYKAEIVKHAFMLAINVIESIAILAFELGFWTSTTPSNYQKIDNCTTEVMYNLDVFRVIRDPIAAAATSFGEAGFLLVLALVTSLMKYLDVVYYDIHGKPFKCVRRFLLVSCLFGIFLIISGSIPQLFILQELFNPVINLIYFCIWVRQTRTFFKALKWRCIEYKVRGVSSQIVKRFFKNCKHFAVFMSLIGIGLVSLILFSIINRGLFLIIIAIRYGPCLFHYLYGTPLYEPLLTANKQIEVLNLSIEIVSWIETALMIVAFLSIGLQYLFPSIGFFGMKLWKSLKYRFGKVRTRFTPSLTNPLLIT